MNDKTKKILMMLAAVFAAAIVLTLFLVDFSSKTDVVEETNGDNNKISAVDVTYTSDQCYSALELIKMGEGYRSCTYLDTMGIPTVCYGYNLNNYGAAQAVANAGGDYNSLKNVGSCTTQSVCDNLLQMAVNSATSSAQSIYGTLSCSYAQAVATDMTYNLGASGMASFTTFISLMKSSNWQGAANDGYGTLWCQQVGSRCTRDMTQLTSCC